MAYLYEAWIDLKTRAIAPFFPDARTFHNIYKLQKHVLLRHQSYLIVFMGGGGILFYLCFTSVRPSKIFFIAFFSVTVDGRNLIFGHKRHVGIP
jgi:hypothetical protein